MFFEDLGIHPRYLIHHRDPKFSLRFDSFIKVVFREYHPEKRKGIIKFATRAPDINAYSESFVASIKRECPEYFFRLGLDQPDHLVQTDVHSQYNVKRLHQGKNNRTLEENAYRPSSGKVIKTELLGSVINQYHRVA